MKNILLVIALVAACSATLVSFNHKTSDPYFNNNCLIEDCATSQDYGYPLAAITQTGTTGINCGTFEDNKCGGSHTSYKLGAAADFAIYALIFFGLALLLNKGLAKKTSSGSRPKRP